MAELEFAAPCRLHWAASLAIQHAQHAPSCYWEQSFCYRFHDVLHCKAKHLAAHQLAESACAVTVSKPHWMQYHVLHLHLVQAELMKRNCQTQFTFHA